MYKKIKVGFLMILASLLLILSGCDLLFGKSKERTSADEDAVRLENEVSKVSGKVKSSENEKINEKVKYNIIYFEYLNNSQEAYPSLDIGYIDINGERKSKIFENYQEKIIEGKKPYLIVENDKAFIYRPPYISYIQDDTDGKIINKKENDE
ncbi:hypothetical protein Bp8pS_037 [Bacillus phage vB_BpuM-BpSp]|nr:hypothetical protein Bp8pS_037 [Bacillus phage vB_BpuM-BpSp]